MVKDIITSAESEFGAVDAGEIFDIEKVKKGVVEKGDDTNVTEGEVCKQVDRVSRKL